MKIFKRALLAIFLLIAAAIIWLLFFFDANQFKPEIEQAAYEQTGRKLTIAGDIDLGLWPPVSLNISDVEFENADGFGEQPMAKLGRLQLITSLFALLDNRLEVKTLNIENVDLRLQKDTAGKSNWEDLSKTAVAEASAEQPQAETDGDVSTPPDFDIAGINISGLNLYYQDQQAQQTIEVKGLEFSSGAIRENLPVAISLSLGVRLNEPQTQLNLSAEGEALWKPAAQQFSLSNTEISINAKGEAVPKGALSSTIQGDLLLDIAKEQFAISKGQLALDNNQADIVSQVSWGENPIRAAVTITAGTVDIREYQQQGETGDQANNQAESSSEQNADSSGDINAIEIPSDWLALLNGSVDIKINELITNTLSAKAVQLVAKVENKQLTISAADAQLFDGSINTSGAFSAAGLQLNLAVSELDAAQAQQAFMGSAYADGKVNLDKVSLSSRGKTVGAMRQNLNGNGAMRVQDAAVHGVNVVAWVKTIQGLLKGGDISSLAEPAPASQGTDFAAVTATFKITNGVLDNRDLLAKSPGARIKGYGWLNLADETLDYFLVPTIVETSQGQGGENRDDLKGVDVPRHCTGPWADMDCRFELEDAVKDKAKQKAKEKVSEKLEEKLGDKLPSGLLDGLFN